MIEPGKEANGYSRVETPATGQARTVENAETRHRAFHAPAGTKLAGMSRAAASSTLNGAAVRLDVMTHLLVWWHTRRVSEALRV